MHAHAIGATFVFTDFLGVDNVHNITQHSHLQLVLHGVFHVSIVDHIASDLGVLHGLGVVAIDILVGDDGSVGCPSLIVFLGLQGTDILLNHGLEGFGVDVAHEGEHEVVGILKAVGIEFKCFGIVDFVVVFGSHALDERVIVVHGEHEVVAESGVRVGLDVGDHGLGAGDIGLECLFIATG